MPTKSGKAFVGWTKNIVKDNISKIGSSSGSFSCVNKDTGKYNFSIFQNNSLTGEVWGSFYIDVSGLAGKTLTISGKLAGLTESSANFRDLCVGQGNTGEYPYHITGSPDSKQVCNKASYSDGLYFSHTVTIIDNPSIIGLCIWGNVLSAGGKVELTVENLQVEVGSSASDFESPAQPLFSTTQKKCYTDETYVAMWDTNVLDTMQTFGVIGWSGSASQLSSSNGYRYVFSVDGKKYNEEDRTAWVSFYLDMSSYVGKIVTISGQLFNATGTGARLYHLSVGQGNTGEDPYHITGSPDSIQVCNNSTYTRLLNFSHSVRIIDNPSIIGLCIWINDIQNSSANVDVTIYDLQIGVYG